MTHKLIALDDVFTGSVISTEAVFASSKAAALKELRALAKTDPQFGFRAVEAIYFEHSSNGEVQVQVDFQDSDGFCGIEVSTLADDHGRYWVLTQD